MCFFNEAGFSLLPFISLSEHFSRQSPNPLIVRPYIPQLLLNIPKFCLGFSLQLQGFVDNSRYLLSADAGDRGSLFFFKDLELNQFALSPLVVSLNHIHQSLLF